MRTSAIAAQQIIDAVTKDLEAGKEPNNQLWLNHITAGIDTWTQELIAEATAAVAPAPKTKAKPKTPSRKKKK